MSEPSSSAGPRRSQRDKKQPKPITTVTASSTARKRKHVDTDDEGPTENDGDGLDDEVNDPDDVEADVEGSDDGDDDDERPKKSRKKSTKGPAAKKPRTAATATRKPRKPRVPKDPAAPTSKKRATNDPNAPFDPATLTKATNIKSDNPLFNAILNPNAALQGTVEDFLESLDQDENQSLAELVNMILRCCACNDSIDGDTAVDYDGVVDRLDDMVEDMKKTTSPNGTYPLISKASPFHYTKMKYSFRSNLSEFISRLINSAALLGSLYSTQLMETLQNWLVPMASSQIRSIRHTSTVVALEVEAALCQVGKDVEKEAELTGRMREGEKKRARAKTKEKGGAAADANSKGKEKELEKKMREIKERQGKLKEFIKEYLDGVFIHRYRDLDPVIRTECISSLSTFFEVLPSYFCSNSDYLRYVGWVLSDTVASVRLAALKALRVVYEGAGAGADATKNSKKKGKGSEGAGGVVLPALTLFTTRFLSRLLEIARFDVDVGVRVAVMGVLGCVDELGLLSESARKRLGTLVFSDEARVRKGVSRFVSGVWEEWVEGKIGELEVDAAPAPNAKGRGAAGKNKGRTAKANNAAADVDRDKLGIKGIVSLLFRWGRALDRQKKKDQDKRDGDGDGDGDEEEEEEEDEDTEALDGATVADTDISGGATGDAQGIAPALVNSYGKKAEATMRGRTGLAVEALWDELDVVRDWEGILDMLVLDHSASGENGIPRTARSSRKGRTKSGMKGRGRQVNGDGGDGEGSEEEEEDDDDSASTSTRVDQSWRLSEVEEGVLLEILVASLRRTKKDDDTTAEPITQALIKALPRLFIKYQTDENRINDVLALPTLMNLEVYLEMRETNAYTSLWSDVCKQFLTHTSPFVIITAVQTITSHLLANTALSNINTDQILELEDELASSLRDAIAGPPDSVSRETDPSSSSTGSQRDIEICHLTEDEILTLTSVVLRLRTLAGQRDMTTWMEENEGGKQSSAWDILYAISERARLSVGGEGEMLEQCLQLLTLHIIWKSKSRNSHPTRTEPSAEEAKDEETFITQRDNLLEKLIEYAVGTQVQGNGIVDGVKRVAFKSLLDLYVLFGSTPSESSDADGSDMGLIMDDEVQWRCAGFVQAEVERYAEAFNVDDGENASRADSETEDDEDEQGADEEGDAAKDKSKEGKKKKANSKENVTEVDFSSRSNLEQEYVFLGVIAAFLRAMRAGAIQVRHGAILLAHYGRLGPAFDSCAKLVVEGLKEEGMAHKNGELVVLVITQTMKEAFSIFKSSNSSDESNVVALAKLLSSSFLIRGSQLAVVRRLDAQYVVEVQTSLITWVIKQIATQLSLNNKKDLKTVLLFFRALVPLLTTVQSRDALKIKAHLDQALVQAKIQPGTTKMWDPYRAYEKRLGTAMGKDKPSAPKARGRKKKKDGGMSTDGEQSEVEQSADDEETLSDGNAPPPPPKLRARPQRPRRAANKAPTPETNGLDSEPEAEPSTPKARPRPRATYKAKSSASPAKTTADASQSTNGLVTPGPSRKRPREDEDEGEEENHVLTPQPARKRVRDGDGVAESDEQEGRQEEQGEAQDEEEAIGGEDIPNGNGDAEMQPEPQPTPGADVRIRRKRIRL